MIPTEHQEQAAFCQWLTLKRIVFFAIPNENNQSFENRKRAMIIENKARAIGKKKGVPDICVMLKDRIVFIEMKRTKQSTVSPEQREWNETINGFEYAEAYICKGFAEARAVIEKLL